MLDKLIKKIEGILRAFKTNNVVELRRISNKTIEEAIVESDELLAQISLISYSLHKILLKQHITESKKWLETKLEITKSLNRAIENLKKDDLIKFKKTLDRIALNVSGVDKITGRFLQNIYEKAKIKQASRAYALGLSLSQASTLTNANKKQLLEYIGVTKIHDQVKAKIGIRQRMKYLKEVF